MFRSAFVFANKSLYDETQAVSYIERVPFTLQALFSFAKEASSLLRTYSFTKKRKLLKSVA